MKLIGYLNRPEYLFRPTQIYKRFFQPNLNQPQEFVEVPLPWGIKIKVRPDDDLGLALLKMGIYDLSVTEIIWRLIDPGETALDIGANIGYMTSIMANRVGKTGKVLAFEPHPEIHAELLANLNLWKETQNWQQIQAYSIALSNQTGTGILATSNYFNSNRGTAALAPPQDFPNSNLSLETHQYSVTLKTLDEIISFSDPIDLIKIDVEGHEMAVLEGAKDLIQNHRIRDIVFEDHQPYPSPVTHFLESNQYTIFRISKGFLKPRLESPNQKLPDYIPFWEPPSYLATQNPQRVSKRLQKWGWYSLQTNAKI